MNSTTPDDPLGPTLRRAVANFDRQIAAARHRMTLPNILMPEADHHAHQRAEIARLTAERVAMLDLVDLWDGMTAAERRHIGVMPTRAQWFGGRRAEVHRVIGALSGAGERRAA